MTPDQHAAKAAEFAPAPDLRVRPAGERPPTTPPVAALNQFPRPPGTARRANPAAPADGRASPADRPTAIQGERGERRHPAARAPPTMRGDGRTARTDRRPRRRWLQPTGRRRRAPARSRGCRTAQERRGRARPQFYREKSAGKPGRHRDVVNQAGAPPPQPSGRPRSQVPPNVAMSDAIIQARTPLGTAGSRGAGSAAGGRPPPRSGRRRRRRPRRRPSRRRPPRRPRASTAPSGGPRLRRPDAARTKRRRVESCRNTRRDRRAAGSGDSKPEDARTAPGSSPRPGPRADDTDRAGPRETGDPGTDRGLRGATVWTRGPKAHCTVCMEQGTPRGTQLLSYRPQRTFRPNHYRAGDYRRDRAAEIPDHPPRLPRDGGRRGPRDARALPDVPALPQATRVGTAPRLSQRNPDRGDPAAPNRRGRLPNASVELHGRRPS